MQQNIRDVISSLSLQDKLKIQSQYFKNSEIREVADKNPTLNKFYSCLNHDGGLRNFSWQGQPGCNNH